ncbi:hypothetical protein I9W82_000975 [Candida metapsilosis]|uniref:Uncharacterized protein n=1 Tax=Candida metapsilosis TaxID=273372 RepID=A0A8H8DDU9_9ASCO|nr:hypothetical protein I9W82_000975 [Candida metapsilosis]
MVTISDLKRLEALHKKNEKGIKVTNKQEPDLFSIEWLIKEELNREGTTDTTDLTEVNLRNKRLELLFQSIEDNSEEENVINRAPTGENTHGEEIREETSINYPTTFLKPHELTNDLEIDLMESSLFSNKHNHQLNDTNSMEQNSFDLAGSVAKSNSVVNESLKSGGSVSSSLPGTRALVSKRQAKHKRTRNQSSSLGFESPLNNINLKPVKRFRSVSSCDLVFPNLNFKKPKR